MAKALIFDYRLMDFYSQKWLKTMLNKNSFTFLDMIFFTRQFVEREICFASFSSERASINVNELETRLFSIFIFHV